MTNYESKIPEPMPLSATVNAFLDDLHSGVGFKILSPRDGSPPILDSDYESSVTDENLRMYRETEALQVACGEFGAVLSGKIDHTTDSTPIERLATGSSVFIELPDESISGDLAKAGELFGAGKTGAIFRTAFTNFITANTAIAYGGRIDAFPAFQRDDTNFRVLYGSSQDAPQPEALQVAFDLLSLPSEVAETEGINYVITEFIDGLESPKRITQAQLDDWLERVERSGVYFDLDIAPEDETLDNFVLYNDQLRWVDGNLMYARISETDGSEFAEEQKLQLQHFVES